MGGYLKLVCGWLAIVALALLSCQHGRSGEMPIEELIITPSLSSLALGRSMTYVAKARYADGRFEDVTDDVDWSTSDPTMATVDVAGQVTAAALGAVSVRARHHGMDVSATGQLLVLPAALESIDVTPANTSLALGTTQQLVATGVFSDNTVQDLTSSVIWTSSASSVARVSSSGLVIALAVGASEQRATHATSGVTGSATLTVTDAVLVAVEVTPISPSIALGTTLQLTAMGRFSDNTVQDLTTEVAWSASNGSVASVANASGTEGLVSSVAVGSTSIAAAHISTGLVDSTALLVTAAVLVSVGVTPGAPSIALGTNQQFVATGVFSDNTVQDLTATVTWSSSASGVATVSNAGGTEGLASSVSVGSATIDATHLGSGLAGSSTLEVTAATLVAVTVTPPAPSVALGTGLQFSATGTYTDSSTQDLTDAVTWNSSAPAVATVSNAGGSEGYASSASQGATSITATHPASGLSDSESLTVTAAALVSVAVTPSDPSIALGLSQQFVATGTYSDSSQQDLTEAVTWDSGTPAVATVSNAGGSEGLATTVAVGSSSITATEPSSGLSDVTTLTVTAAVLTAIAVTPSLAATSVGSTEQFTATGTYSDSSTQDLTAAVTWSSSATYVATISNAGGTEGLATGLASGTTTISATHPASGLNDATTLTVTAVGIGVRGVSSQAEPSGVTTLTLTTPGLTTAGDVLFAAIAVRPQGAAISEPVGWTLVRRSNSAGGASNSLAVYTRVATVGEPSSHAFVLSTSTGSAGGLVALYAVDSLNPVNVEDGQSTGSGLAHEAPDVTTTVGSAMLVTAHSFASSATWTEPAGMTELVDLASQPVPSAVGIALSMHFELLGAAGATGARSAVASGEADAGNGIAVAFTPQ